MYYENVSFHLFVTVMLKQYDYKHQFRFCLHSLLIASVAEYIFQFCIVLLDEHIYCNTSL